MAEQLSKTIVKFLSPEDVGEDLSGWWILCMEPLENGDMGPDREGYCWDAIGPFESEDEANHNLEEHATV